MYSYKTGGKLLKQLEHFFSNINTAINRGVNTCITNVSASNLYFHIACLSE